MTPPLKTCFKCGKTLPLDDFYRHAKMKDGHLNKCKACTRKDNKENRYNHIDYYRNYDSMRQKTERRKSWKITYQRIVRKTHPEKYHCRQIFGKALKKGLVIKQPCEICGLLENIEGHHEDYSKPLDVIWLCFKHHRWIHS